VSENDTREARLANLKLLKQRERRLKKDAEQAKAERERFEAELFEEMESTNTYAQRQGDAQYVLKSTVYGTLTDKDAFYEWCKTAGLDDEMFRETEEKQRLNELVRAALDNNEELPPGVGFFTKRYISITEKN
jgi:hypothetical protein